VCTSLQVATVVAVYGNINLGLPKGVGWGWAGFTWLYNMMLLLALLLICKYWRVFLVSIQQFLWSQLRIPMSET
jgi:hypothetical protein